MFLFAPGVRRENNILKQNFNKTARLKHNFLDDTHIKI